jgi:hypothetical protein
MRSRIWGETMRMLAASALLGLLLVGGCNDSLSPTRLVSIRIDPRAVNAIVGVPSTVTVSGSRADGTRVDLSPTDIQFVIANTQVATVTAVGVVTLTRPDNTFLRASYAYGNTILRDSIPVQGAVFAARN